MTEDEMVGWHHQLNGLEFEKAQGDGEGQGSLVCCSPWGRRKSDRPERRNSSTWKKEHHCVCVCSARVCVCVYVSRSF